MASLTTKAAAFGAQLRSEDVPDAVRRKAVLHVLDTIGCGLAGASSELTRRMLAYLDVEHRAGPCVVLGAARRYGPAAAAFANAAAMNALDFDDGFEEAGRGMGHPGATIVGAALSASSLQPVSGASFVAAVVGAYELNNRLIRAMQPTRERFRLVYGVCQHQSVGAALAFGRLLGLDAGALHNAIGLAATLANVPSLRKYNWQERPLVDLKDFNAPAAEAGVRAVQLHRAGIVGARDVLDGDGGLWRMLGSDRFDGAGFAAALGERWTLAQNSFKPYPACRWLHGALEAFETVAREHRLSPAAIERVVVHTSEGLARDLMDPAPATLVDAQFSLPYACAAVAHGIRPGADWYTPATLARADLRAWATRVEAEIDPVVDAAMRDERRPAGRVTVRAHGIDYPSTLVTHPRGGAERPLTEDEVLAKFLGNAGPVIGAARAEALAGRLLGLEVEPDVARLFEAARPGRLRSAHRPG